MNCPSRINEFVIYENFSLSLFFIIVIHRSPQPCVCPYDDGMRQKKKNMGHELMLLNLCAKVNRHLAAAASLELSLSRGEIDVRCKLKIHEMPE
jgi:hypothetical protein